MKPSVIIIDDFYENPYQVRDYATSLSFSLNDKKAFPGLRTNYSYSNEKILNIFKQILSPYYSYVIFNPKTATCMFQYTTIHDTSWIHKDNYCKETKYDSNNFDYFSAICYLSPNPPVESGTTLYKDENENRSINALHNEQKNVDEHKFVRTDYICNKFNRIVLFDGSIYHTAETYFGENKYDARLTQVFFLLAIKG